jgi:hypothetical protein
MLSWKLPIMIAILGAASGALYIRMRWHRAPQAYRAMIALAAGYGIVGIFIGAWVLHLDLPENSHPILCGKLRRLRPSR